MPEASFTCAALLVVSRIYRHSLPRCAMTATIGPSTPDVSPHMPGQADEASLHGELILRSFDPAESRARRSFSGKPSG